MPPRNGPLNLKKALSTMLGNHAEYDKMAAAEPIHWWYDALHRQVLKAIQKQFNHQKDIDLLDAGCGTGGLMLYLKNLGYTTLQGFDLSDDALQHCRKRGLTVSKMGLVNSGAYYRPQSMDVIVCCDALYFLEFNEQQKVLADFYNMLKPNGLLLLNLPALDVFSGTHDISVGITRRYHHSQLQRLLPGQFARHATSFRYWPVTLSPVIAFVRARQRMKLQSGVTELVSDVSLPVVAVNTLLKAILAIEMQLPPLVNFGSSLFVAAIKK